RIVSRPLLDSFSNGATTMHTHTNTQSLWPTATELKACEDFSDAGAPASDRLWAALQDLVDCSEPPCLLMYMSAPYAPIIEEVRCGDPEVLWVEDVCRKMAELAAIYAYIGSRIALARQHVTAGEVQ